MRQVRCIPLTSEGGADFIANLPRTSTQNRDFHGFRSILKEVRFNLIENQPSEVSRTSRSMHIMLLSKQGYKNLQLKILHERKKKRTNPSAPNLFQPTGLCR